MVQQTVPNPDWVESSRLLRSIFEIETTRDGREFPGTQQTLRELVVAQYFAGEFASARKAAQEAIAWLQRRGTRDVHTSDRPQLQVALDQMRLVLQCAELAGAEPWPAGRREDLEKHLSSIQVPPESRQAFTAFAIKVLSKLQESGSTEGEWLSREIHDLQRLLDSQTSPVCRTSQLSFSIEPQKT